MSPYYNTSYKKEEVDKIVEEIINCIKEDNFIISMNPKRQENIDFVDIYRIDDKRQKEILLELKVKDFCYSLQNTNPGYKHEVLYVFAPIVELRTVEDEKKNVSIYIKINVSNKLNKNKVVVISFHECNKPIKRLFK